LPFSISGKKINYISGVEFEKIKNITFLIYNEGIFFQNERFSLACLFNIDSTLG